MRILEFDGPAAYRIVVQGRLGESFRGRLGDLQVESRKGQGRGQVTSLTGPVRDQAELSGIMNSLYGMHLSVLEVVRIKTPVGTGEEMR